jgi:hypothetical protein
MNKQLPFELHKEHKKFTKSNWKNQSKMIFTETEFEYWYNKIIYSTHCSLEKCKKPFISSHDRHLDHDHKTRVIRDIICTKCNKKRKDNKIQSNNTSGFKNINKHYNKTCKQGFYWVFKINIKGKIKTIKTSVNKEKLIEFAEKWYIENNYFT